MHELPPLELRLEDFRAIADRNPFDALVYCKNAYDVSNRGKYELLNFPAELVLSLENDAEKFEVFVGHSHWANKPQKPNRNKLSIPVCMFMLGVKETTDPRY